MGFKATEWEFSDVVDNKTIPPVEGEQYAQIVSASYNDKDGTYKITVQSLTNNAEFDIRYWLFQRDEDSGAFLPNSRDRGTLVTLGVALAGEPIGIPNPVDIIGCYVKFELKLSKPDAKGNSYPRVYKFMAVPEDIAILSPKEQYYTTE